MVVVVAIFARLLVVVGDGELQQVCVALLQRGDVLAQRRVFLGHGRARRGDFVLKLPVEVVHRVSFV